MVHQSIQPLLPDIITLFKRHKITSAYLFGSVLTDSFNDQSDVDFLVNIQEDYKFSNNISSKDHDSNLITNNS